ncbi:MAG TPA: bifunctional diguanylate cyclase/phosphodiesterase [Methylococcaceae bacterium]|nr:bifunctional diguanylate cyclase/phosphodiesterase [Methylococcaceae bacterium]
MGAFSDITHYKEAETEIHNLAFYDPLTGLPNRRLLLDRLRHALAASGRLRDHGAVLFIDLDHFKNLNDTKGHDIGDLLLVEVAARLRAGVRTGDTVARFGGDEFVVLLEGLSLDAEQAVSHAKTVAEKLLEAVNRPCLLQEQEHRNGASIGATLYRGTVTGVEELLKRADTAMYQAKSGGRNTVRFFDPHMQTALEARVALESDLRAALARDQFRLYYQIQVDDCQRAIGAEALLRWVHPRRGIVSPAEFIPLAEETGLIVSIGYWVLRTACITLKQWESDPLTQDLQLAVNVSARQFRQADFVEEVCRILAETGAAPSRLKLELTESMVLDDPARAIEKMRALKETGIHLSMDDFGTGQSSLTYLKRLPFDQIKIDQSFVRDCVQDKNDALMVRTILQMALNFGLDVVAEGVENVAQQAFLQQHGCPVFQGYLFGRPVPLEEFEKELRPGREK